MQIGNLNIEGYAALAPMAGVADRAARELCRAYGAAYTVGELTSAKALRLGDEKSARLLYLSDAERPAGVQLFGGDPDTLAAAAEKAMEYAPDFIDLNMGCPAPKIVSNGAGSALHRDPALAARITAAVVSAVRVPVTVKMRAGFAKDSVNAVEMALRCEAAGAAAITVHGRTRDQMYAPPVDLEIIRQVKEAVCVPVVGNGDIRSPQDAARMLESTGCDFLMVGRGALGSPWLFAQINARLSSGAALPDPPVAERMWVMLSHIEKMVGYKGEHTGLREARKHAAYYLKGLRGAAALRRDCGNIGSMEDVRKIAARAIELNPEDGRD